MEQNLNFLFEQILVFWSNSKLRLFNISMDGFYLKILIKMQARQIGSSDSTFVQLWGFCFFSESNNCDLNKC